MRYKKPFVENNTVPDLAIHVQQITYSRNSKLNANHTAATLKFRNIGQVLITHFTTDIYFGKYNRYIFLPDTFITIIALKYL